MKTTLTLITAFLLTFSAAPSEAQTYPNSTTLSAAITATDTVVTLASGTNVEAGGALWIDAEMLPIQSCAVAACTRVNVTRPFKPQPHGTTAVVTVVRAAARARIMLTSSAAYRVGQCSTSSSSVPATALAAYQFLPIFDIDEGWVYMCRRNGASGTWVWNRLHVQAINGEAGSVWTAWP